MKTRKSLCFVQDVYGEITVMPCHHIAGKKGVHYRVDRAAFEELCNRIAESRSCTEPGEVRLVTANDATLTCRYDSEGARMVTTDCNSNGLTSHYEGDMVKWKTMSMLLNLLKPAPLQNLTTQETIVFGL